MKIHHVTPFRQDKDLGRAYNEAFEHIGDDDWICIRDIDTLFLHHSQPNIIEEYVKMFPEAGILTCYTNRIGSADQKIYMKGADTDTNMKTHLSFAEQLALAPHGLHAHEIIKPISGFLMVISKRTWDQFKFKEGALCLGIDTDFSQRILDAGLKIILMDSVYVWHTYRLLQGISNKKHLL